MHKRRKNADLPPIVLKDDAVRLSVASGTRSGAIRLTREQVCCLASEEEVVVVASREASPGVLSHRGVAASAEHWPRFKPSSKTLPHWFDRPQPCIDSLISTHRAAIDALRMALSDEPLFDDDVHDDLWLLLFLLSNSFDAAVRNVRATLRLNYDNAAAFAKAAVGVPHPRSTEFNSYLHARVLPGATPFEEPLLVLRPVHARFTALMDEFTEDEVINGLTYDKELLRCRCLEACRRTRRLVKMVSVIDLAGVSWHHYDRRALRALQRSSRESATYFPGLLGLSIIVNPPSFFRALWLLAKHSFPRRILQKFHICSSKDTITVLELCTALETTV